MKQQTMFIKNNFNEVRSVNEVQNAKCEVRSLNKMRSAEFGLRSKIEEKRNSIHNLSFILYTLYFIIFSTYCNSQTILDS